MTADVLLISEGMGPPETLFEREAVETLLQTIRAFERDYGCKPEAMVAVLVSSGERLSFQVTHCNQSCGSTRMLKAFAGAVLIKNSSE